MLEKAEEIRGGPAMVMMIDAASSTWRGHCGGREHKLELRGIEKGVIREEVATVEAVLARVGEDAGCTTPWWMNPQIDRGDWFLR